MSLSESCSGTHITKEAVGERMQKEHRKHMGGRGDFLVEQETMAAHQRSPGLSCIKQQHDTKHKEMLVLYIKRLPPPTLGTEE